MSYTPFKQMEAKLSKRPGVTNAAGLAAVIARKKYGTKAVKKAAAGGTSLRGHKTKPDLPTPGDTRDAAIAQFVGKHGR